ncbi:uncharacterized protein prom isoform X2 [Euwallacea fornicatus]|uniref:uncharacterized protein prom isoform X2 n=1 Tax=Euwallacea fornicatus TaxID=995702 RepID=UPI00338E77EE
MKMTSFLKIFLFYLPYFTTNHISCVVNTTKSCIENGEVFSVMCSNEREEVSTFVIPITLEQTKVKELTNDNLTSNNSDNSGLQFLDTPKGDDLKIHELQLEDQPLLFEPFSSLMGYLLPSEFPIDIFREVFQQSRHIWIIQIIKLEILLVVWIIFWTILSVSLPVGVVAAFLTPLNVGHPEAFPNTSLVSSRQWTEKTLGCLLHLFLVLILCPLILILVANEQMTDSLSKAPHAVNIIYEDLETFIRNTHLQISFATTSATDLTVEAIRKELEDMDLRLGRLYQQRLSLETGLDLALMGLQELAIEASKVSVQISDLLADCNLALQLSATLHTQLQDVSRQLLSIQQQCVPKDRPLCFAVQFSGYDVPLQLDNVTRDNKMLQLAGISSKEGTFNFSVEIAKKAYGHVPARIVEESVSFVSDFNEVLNRKRAEVYKSTHELDIVARNLLEEVTESQKAIFALANDVVKWDLWRWMAILGTAAVISLAWGLLLCGAPCGCKLTSKNACYLKSGVALCCFGCLLVCAIGTISLVIGGHGNTLLCRPLYDHPHYNIGSKFLDAEGLLYPKAGFFQALSNENGSIKIAEVLKACQRDQPAYHTFHLKNHLNVDTILNYKKWEDLNVLLEGFATAQTTVEILSPGLQLKLQILASNTAANFTYYRETISASLREKDLGSFADQLNNVARQLIDPVIGRKIENLAFSVRNVAQDTMQRRNDLRSRILYKITMLEVLLPPLNRRVDQSLSHLKTIQFFLDHQGSNLSEMVRREFIGRIENYLEELHEHALKKVTKEIGKCRPLWDIFHVFRIYMCKLTFDPLNAIAFGSYFLILIFIATNPVAIKLTGFYREAKGSDMCHSLTSLRHRNSRQSLLIEDDRIWTTPCSASPEGSKNVPVAWTSPLSRIPQVSVSLSPPRSRRSVILPCHPVPPMGPMLLS